MVLYSISITIWKISIEQFICLTQEKGEEDRQKTRLPEILFVYLRVEIKNI